MALIAIAMSLYHMHAAAFGPPEALVFRGTHLLFALTLVALLYPMKRDGGNAWRIADAIFLVLAWKVGGHWGLDRWLLPVLGTRWARAEAQVDRIADRAEREGVT